MALTLNCSQFLENTRREYGGVDWLGCGVVDIALVWGGGWQPSQKQNRGSAGSPNLSGSLIMAMFFQGYFK
jgi:hypothetical protein